MIEINALNFKYGKYHVFNDISLSFKSGQIYGLLGQNGVGKTTLLKIIAGLQRVHSGECVIDGKFPYDRLPSLLQETYILPEEPEIPAVQIEEFAKNTGAFYPRFDLNKFYSIMKEFGVDPKSKFSKLSLGQRKKSMIAIALSLNTRYILLDEPSNGLDIPSKSLLCRLIARQCSDDVTIIISTHQVKDMENLISPIIILDRDEVLLDASIEEISDKLYFSYSREKDPSAFYCEQVPGGYVCISANEDNMESKVNIEALFNAVLSNKHYVKELFKK